MSEMVAMIFANQAEDLNVYVPNNQRLLPGDSTTVNSSHHASFNWIPSTNSDALQFKDPSEDGGEAVGGIYWNVASTSFVLGEDSFENGITNMMDVNASNNGTVVLVPWKPSLSLSPAGLACILLLVGTVVGNILVCLAISKERRLQNMTNYFLMSLAFTDLMVAVLVMPIGVITINEGYFPLPPVCCLLWVLLDVLFCTCSIMHLCTISVDRFLSLRYPIKYGRVKTRKRVVLKICFVWIMSVGISLPLTLLYAKDQQLVMRDGACNIQDPLYVTIGSVVCFYIPLVVMLVTYALTVHLLHQKEVEFRAATSSISTPTIHADASAQNKALTPLSANGSQCHHTVKVSSSSLWRNPSYNWRRFLIRHRSSSVSTPGGEVSASESPALSVQMHSLDGNGDASSSSLGMSPPEDPSGTAEPRHAATRLMELPTSLTPPMRPPSPSVPSCGNYSEYHFPIPVTPSRKEVHAIRKYSVKYRPPVRNLDFGNLGAATTTNIAMTLLSKPGITLPASNNQQNSLEPAPGQEELWVQVTTDPAGKNPQTALVSAAASALNVTNLASGRPAGDVDSSHASKGAATLLATTSHAHLRRHSCGSVNRLLPFAGSGGGPRLLSLHPFQMRQKQQQQPQQQASPLMLNTTVGEVPGSGKCYNDDTISIDNDSYSTTSSSFRDPSSSVSSSFRDPSSSVSSRPDTVSTLSGSDSSAQPLLLRSFSTRSSSSRATSIRRSTMRHGRFIRTEKKATKVLGIIFFTFVLLWAPFFLLNLLRVCDRCMAHISPMIEDTALWLGYASSMVNPIFYTIFNKTFRKTFKRILKCQWNEIKR